MKIKIDRFAPHQTAKILSVMMALISLIFAIPMGLIVTLWPIPAGPNGPVLPPGYIFFFFPFLYLSMGYLGTRVWCAFYNFVARYTGGIEFETSDQQSKL